MNDEYPPQSPTSVGFAGRCPRCAQGKLFKNFLDLAPACDVCGLDYKFADAADGPAFFVMSIAGFILVGAALWIEFTFDPPFWVHLLTTLPLALIFCVGLLRPLKGLMVALQYRNKAEEGRLEQ
jgi:uncharacterized protein (DUF983 family)